MKPVFADTFYWVARLNPRDAWHERAKDSERALSDRRMVTTDEVLVEVLAEFSGRGQYWRGKAAQLVRNLITNANIQVLPQTHESFLKGLGLYEARPDKAYSLTDCISMSTMRRLHIAEVLTADSDFKQDGFTCLMEPPGRES